MARYIARFMKNVLGERMDMRPKSVRARSRSEAPSQAEAAELAKIRFCECEVEGLVAPRRPRRLPMRVRVLEDHPQHDPGKFGRSISSTRASDGP